jgi:tetratricopeptide (TPR) repeat protein
VATDLDAHRTIELNLRPLTAEDSNKLIDSLLTIADLPISLRENIMIKAEGNPFFVEEVIRTLIDAGDVVRDESGAHWVARNDGSGVEIPENLQALLTTRIDQLEEQPRQVLQIASLIGRNFYYRVLERVLALQTQGGNGQGPALSGELNEHLTTLQYADLIREVARIPELEYIFRHGLTQEAAYRTILLKLRREYHRMVGEVIEELFVDHLEEHAATLARHFKEASDAVRALRYYTLAGDVAFRLFALSEAIEHYSQALTLIDPLTADKDELVHLFLRRGRAYELINSYDDVLEGYAELERVATDREDDSLKMAALLARTIVHSTFTPIFDPKLGLPLAEEAIALARKLDDFAAEAKILWSLMLVHAFALGDLETGASYGQQALVLARRHQLTEQLPYILNDLGRIMGFNGQIREGLPLIAEARPLFEESAKDAALEGLRIARSINNRFGIDDGIFRLSEVYAERGKFGRALEGWESVISKSEAVQHEIMILPALSYIYVELDAASAIPARFEAVRDQVDVAGPIFRIMFLAELTRLYIYLEELSEAENIWLELDLDIEQEKLIPLKVPVFLAYAELLFARQQYEQAVVFLERMTAEQEAMGCYWYWGDAVLFWAKGLLIVDPSQTDKARVVLENACTRIREMGIKRVLWKALLALATLVEEDEAGPLRREAQEIVTWIAEGIEDPDLRQSFLNLPVITSNLSVNQ